MLPGPPSLTQGRLFLLYELHRPKEGIILLSQSLYPPEEAKNGFAPCLLQWEKVASVHEADEVLVIFYGITPIQFQAGLHLIRHSLKLVPPSPSGEGFFVFTCAPLPEGRLVFLTLLCP